MQKRKLQSTRNSNIKSIIKRWTNLIDAFTKELAPYGDAPFWYNERTNLGILAGAVWQNGGYVLEEISIQNDFRDKKTTGRADCCFRWMGQNYIIESKQYWPPFSIKNFKLTENLNRKFDDIDKQIHKYAAPDEQLWGMIFVVPSLPKKQKNYVGEYIRNFTKSLINYKKLNRDISLAYVFPQSARELVYEEEGRIYPGVVLVGKDLGAK